MRVKALLKAGVLAAVATCATVAALADEYDDGQIKTTRQALKGKGRLRPALARF